MFDNVLVGVDGRPGGRDAIALATQLMDPDGRLTLVHVHHGEVAEERGDTRELLERERDRAGVEAELVSAVAANPGRGLHQQADERGADLLVVGSCSRGVLGRAMLGDDTRAALNGAPCAVAIASRGYAEHPAPLANVGVAYNGSPQSEVALAAARELAARTRATVHAVEVVAIPSVAYTGIVAPGVGETIDAMLEEASSRMRETARRRGPRRLRPRRRGARRVRRAAGHPRGRLARLRADAPPDASAAPPPTCSATRAARCSCCPASPPSTSATPSRSRARQPPETMIPPEPARPQPRPFCSLRWSRESFRSLRTGTLPRRCRSPCSSRGRRHSRRPRRP